MSSSHVEGGVVVLDSKFRTERHCVLRVAEMAAVCQREHACEPRHWFGLCSLPTRLDADRVVDHVRRQSRRASCCGDLRAPG